MSVNNTCATSRVRLDPESAAKAGVGEGAGTTALPLVTDFSFTISLATALRPLSGSLLILWRSARRSEACWYRSFRSFSSARLMMSSSFWGRSGFNRIGEIGSRFIIDSKITPEVSPRNGKVPVAISYRTEPNENRSVRASNSLPRTCSGDMYATVPSAVPGLVRCCSSMSTASGVPSILLQELAVGMTFANPKSRIFAWPRFVTNMLAGLMSR
jgi:hypothetical protein